GCGPGQAPAGRRIAALGPVARIAVVARDEDAGAGAVQADVADGAGAAVVTRGAVRLHRRRAARHRVAHPGQVTAVERRADGRPAARARAGAAGVGGRAGVAVVAERAVGRLGAPAHAPGAGVAERAGVPVVAGGAVRSCDADAGATLAGVRGRARITVVAGSGDGGVHAAGRRVAGVGGARVPVVARQWCPRHAGEILALLRPVADVGVDAVRGRGARCRAARAVDADVRRGDQVEAEDHVRQRAAVGDVEQRERPDELAAGQVAR